MKADTIRFTTAKKLPEIVEITRCKASKLKATIGKIEDDPFGSVRDDQADIAVCVTGKNFFGIGPRG